MVPGRASAVSEPPRAATSVEEPENAWVIEISFEVCTGTTTASGNTWARDDSINNQRHRRF